MEIAMKPFEGKLSSTLDKEIFEQGSDGSII
jgi:hypothetical protein